MVAVERYREQATRLAGEQAQPGVLDAVGVLELVDQQVAEALAVVLEQCRLLQPQLVRAQQQLGEVDHAGLLTGGLVGGVDAHHLALERVAAVVEVRGPQPLVLACVDPVLCLFRRPARLVEIEAAQHPAQQPVLVVGVEDLEGLGEFRLAPVQPQQAVGKAVEGADPQAAGRHAEQRFGAATHLGGGLVGERHGEQRMGRDALDLQQPGDAMDQHPGLAAAGAGQHQQRPGRSADRLALGLVEVVEEVRDVHRAKSNRAPVKV
jgi:hypothetical protein